MGVAERAGFWRMGIIYTRSGKEKTAKKIDCTFSFRWDTVFVGFLLQFSMGVFVLRTTVGFDIFAKMGNWVETMTKHSCDSCQ